LIDTTITTNKLTLAAAIMKKKNGVENFEMKK
jgi:hypothetical protein